MVCRVIIKFDEHLESVSIDGDELKNISVFREEQIKDGTCEIENRDFWNRLLLEIRNQVGDAHAKLNIEVICKEKYREPLVKFLEELESGTKTESDEAHEYMLDYYKMAADYNDSAEAQYKVAEYYDQCYQRNRGEREAEADDALEKAVIYYEKAANQGYQMAIHPLFARLSECGRQQEAVAWMQMLAERGDAEAQFELGKCYAQGNGVEQSMSDAIEWYWKAAEQRNANGQYAIGVCYHYGTGIEKDLTKAAEWLEKAAEQGNAEAQVHLGNYYYGESAQKDFKKAVKWFEKAAKQGSAIAQNNLAVCYINGEGVEKDVQKGVKWLEQAAEQGNAKMQSSLGKRYYSGKGVGKDIKKAIKWFEKAAAQEDAEAQCFLGECYYFGEGVEKNTDKAIEWYEKAALQGNVYAQYKLGAFYGNGTGAEMDKAVKWYQKAAQQGHADAQYRLADYLMRTAGYAEDVDQAVGWYQKAAEKGHLRAKKELRNYYYNMAKKCKALLPDKVMENSIKFLILLASAGALQWFDKPLVFLFEFFIVAGSCLIKPIGYRDTQSYKIMMDCLRKAAELGHKRANIRILFWG